MTKFKFIVFCFLVSFINCAKEPEAVSGPYFPRVKEIISKHCLNCHGSTGTWEGRPTSFDTDEEIVLAYTSIKAALVDPPTLINKRMPQTGSLSSTEIEIVVKWWELGGKITD